MIAAIAATAHKNVIGRDNDLPWYLPDDLKYFSKMTTGNTVIMGRKTADSIIARLGHELPNRQNIVLTTNSSYAPVGFEIAHSVNDALKLAKNDVFVIGGEQIYKAMLPYCTTLHTTQIDADIAGDKHFPKINRAEWHIISSTPHAIDDRHKYQFTFTVLERR